MKPYYDDGKGIMIYHGDCREILPTLPKVDLIVTDPPYGVGIKYKSYQDTPLETTQMVAHFLQIALPVSKLITFTAGNWHTELQLYKFMPPKWRICWYKGAQSTASAIGFNDWEAVLVYGEDVHRNAHDYFYAQPEKMGSFGHPCPKPVKFYTALISRLTVWDDTVCDPFLGSGTGLRAAKDLGRKAIGIEIEEKYCEIAARRLSQEVLQLA